jgi:NHL repeat-containing protein
MKGRNLSRAVLIAWAIACGVEGKSLPGTAAAAQMAPTQARNTPMFEVDPSWPKTPEKWKLGDVSSIAIDAQGNSWVLHRPRTLKPDQAAMAAPPIIVFDKAGTFINAWGGAGNGYEWIEREHGIHIDYKGFVWLGGNNCPGLKLPGLKPVADDQLLKFTPDGKLVMQIGASNQSKGNGDTKNVHRAADVWVHSQTNEAFVADGYGNHRVIVFDADTGAFKRMWGAFANKPVDDDHCEDVPKPIFADAAGPQNFSIVHAIRVANDGTVYVADRENRRVQMFTNDGKFVKQLVKSATPFARNLALSADPNQQFLYVGDGKEISIVERKTLELVGSVKGPGMLGGGHQIATDAEGNLYVAANANGMQKLTFKGMSSLANR